MNCGNGRPEALGSKIAFAVRRPLLPSLVLISCGLTMGCTGPRHTAKYGWLRKHGPVTAQWVATPQAPSSAESETVTAAAVPAPLAYALGKPSVSEVGNRSEHIQHLPVFAPSSPVPAMSVVTHQDTTNYYSPEQHPWNPMALSSLPIAIIAVVAGIASQSLWILLIGGAIAFTLGLIGSRQCRDREDRGKGFAMAGMVLGAVTLFFGLMGLLW